MNHKMIENMVILEDLQVKDKSLLNIIESLDVNINSKHNTQYGNLRNTLVALNKSFVKTTPNIVGKVNKLIEALDEFNITNESGSTELSSLMTKIGEDVKDRSVILNDTREQYKKLNKQVGSGKKQYFRLTR